MLKSPKALRVDRIKFSPWKVTRLKSLLLMTPRNRNRLMTWKIRFSSFKLKLSRRTILSSSLSFWLRSRVRTWKDLVFSQSRNPNLNPPPLKLSPTSTRQYSVWINLKTLKLFLSWHLNCLIWLSNTINLKRKWMCCRSNMMNWKQPSRSWKNTSVSRLK